MTRILVINGSYREQGVTDQIIETMKGILLTAGADVKIIPLRDYPIEFCLNCRKCTQEPGHLPGECIHHDEMEDLITMIERADAYILASPVNFGSVTAIFKRFMERLTVYAYWPWAMNSPKYRKARQPQKKAILISSCAAPGIMGRLVYSVHKQLKMTAQTIGAKVEGTLFAGLVGNEPHHILSDRVQKKVRTLATKLI